MSLRAMLRGVRCDAHTFDHIIDRSLNVRVGHVHSQRAHVGFIARERTAGPAVVREEIRHQIELSEPALATNLAQVTGTDTWSPDDLTALANLIITSVVSTAEQSTAADAAAESKIVSLVGTQLRMILIGASTGAPMIVEALPCRYGTRQRPRLPPRHR